VGLKKRWPQLKKGQKRQNALIVFEDESGCPCCRRFDDLAPRGHTPVLHPSVQLETAVVGWSAGVRAGWQRCRLFFELRPGAYNDEALIAFLSELYEAEQRTVLLIWDGLPSHRSCRMSDWLLPAALVIRRAVARLRTGPQSNRERVGQPEVSGTCQPVRRCDRRGRDIAEEVLPHRHRRRALPCLPRHSGFASESDSRR